MSEQHVGKVVEVIGPVVVAAFEGGHLPPIYNAVRITSQGFEVPDPIDVIAEVEQHLGEGRVKCVAMQPTDGMVRGMTVVDQGGPITVPVGKAHPGTRDERHRRARGQTGSDGHRGTLAHPPPCPHPGRSEHQPGGV